MNVQKKKNPSTFHFETTKLYPQAHYKNKHKKRAFAKQSNKNEVQGWLALQTSVGAFVSGSICLITLPRTLILTFTFK